MVLGLKQVLLSNRIVPHHRAGSLPLVAELAGGVLVEVAAAGVAVGQHRAPPAGRPRGHRGRPPAPAQADDPLGAVDGAGRGGVQQVLGHLLGHELALVEVVGGHQPGRRDPGGLDQGVEAEVLAVYGREPAGLEVDQHLAGDGAVGLAQGEVHLAGQDEPPAGVLVAQAALGDRPPAGLERREALGELHHPVVGLGPQLGPLGLGTPLEEVAEPVVALGEAVDGLVHHGQGVGLAPPVDQDLDGLVGDGAPGHRHRPLERCVFEGDEAPFAPEDAAEGVLADEQGVLGVEVFEQGRQPVVKDLPESVAQLGRKLGPLAWGGAELVEHLLLSRVEPPPAGRRLACRLAAERGACVSHVRYPTVFLRHPFGGSEPVALAL